MSQPYAIKLIQKTDEWELKNIIFPLFFFVIAILLRFFLSRFNILNTEFEFDELSLTTALICNFVRRSINKKIFRATNSQLEDDKERCEWVFELLTLAYFAAYIIFIILTTIYSHLSSNDIILWFIHGLTFVTFFGAFLTIRFSIAIKDHLKLK